MATEDNKFTEREQAVARVLLQGKSNKQIALVLGISTRTVEFHLQNIYAKLSVTSRTEAVLKLSESSLREIPGDVVSSNLVKATVAGMGDSSQNESQPHSRRSPMSKSNILIAGLLAGVLVAVLIVANSTVLKGNVIPTTPGEQLSTVTVSISASRLPVPTETPQPVQVAIPPHTVNGYTATIESYYIDVANLILQVRITGGQIAFGDEDFYGRVRVGDLYDKNGNLINSSAGSGPSPMDPELFQLEFRPQSLLLGDRFEGQFTFALESAGQVNETLARFLFDLDLPLYEPHIYHPKQAVTANGLEILLDQVAITPGFTSFYLCFPPPSYAPWTIGSQSVLQIGGQEANLHHDKLLFGSDIGGDRRAGSEPYWAPPVKNGRCLKAGFLVGNTYSTSLKLTIPELENSAPDVLLTDQLLRDYPGLSPKQAYHKYLEEHGNTFKGPWTFTVDLAQ